MKLTMQLTMPLQLVGEKLQNGKEMLTINGENRKQRTNECLI